MAEHRAGATDDGSRHPAALAGRFSAATPLAIGIVAAGLAAAVLLVASEFATVASVEVGATSCEVIQDTDPELADRCELSGFERNGGSFVLVAVLVAALSFGAGAGGSRPAGVALVLIGAGVVAWALLVDLPVTRETGALGETFADAHARAGSGLTLEILAGALTAGVGAIGYARASSPGPGRIRRRPPRARPRG